MDPVRLIYLGRVDETLSQIGLLDKRRSAKFFPATPLSVGGALLANVNYVTNGGFETGATNIGGWTVSASSNNNGSGKPLSVPVTGNPPQVPASAQCAVDFDPYWNIATGALMSGPLIGTLPQIGQTLSLPAGS